jgi:hypothetical protein
MRVNVVSQLLSIHREHVRAVKRGSIDRTAKRVTNDTRAGMNSRFSGDTFAPVSRERRGRREREREREIDYRAESLSYRRLSERDRRSAASQRRGKKEVPGVSLLKIQTRESPRE